MGLGPGEVRFRNTGPGYLLGRKKLAAERLLPSEQLKSTALCCVHLTRSMLTWYLKLLETWLGLGLALGLGLGLAVGVAKWPEACARGVRGDGP